MVHVNRKMIADLLAKYCVALMKQAFGIKPDVIQELHRSFRGQDVARLLTLVGVLPDDVEV